MKCLARQRLSTNDLRSAKRRGCAFSSVRNHCSPSQVTHGWKLGIAGCHLCLQKHCALHKMRSPVHQKGLLRPATAGCQRVHVSGICRQIFIAVQAAQNRNMILNKQRSLSVHRNWRSLRTRNPTHRAALCLTLAENHIFANSGQVLLSYRVARIHPQGS